MDLPVATITAVDGSETLAQITLAGYRAVKRPRQWDQSEIARLVWKFKVLTGDRQRLEKATNQGEPVVLCTPKGKEVLVNIMESPTDSQGFGLLEYIMM